MCIISSCNILSIIHLVVLIFFLMIRRPPRSTRTDTPFPTRRSSDRPRRWMMIEQPQILRRACEGFEDLRLAEGAVDDAAILHQRQEVAELVEARLDRKQEGAARHHLGDAVVGDIAALPRRICRIVFGRPPGACRSLAGEIARAPPRDEVCNYV